ncbi:YncE family protein [Paenibacillus silagei]|uniref:YVTN family beta-propeller protein n=1 Tax=Paenibacillus silagei TaxID=1670801 RepID=A0ABS4NNE1_9BACL|nr:hypothetical protein [Paenibacillus silagei]MBP2111589.1 YVTN family beta-propeller protein [Paenibacillus silagei]
MNSSKANANSRNLPSGNPYVFVSYEFDYQFGYVAVIDPAEQKVINRIQVGREPGPMCMDYEEKKLYVVNTRGNSVTIIDAVNGDVIKTVHVGTPGNININPVAVFAAPNVNKVYVANAGDHSVTIIDSEKDTVITTVDVGVGRPFAFAGNEKSDFVYLACKVADKKDYVIAITIDDDNISRFNSGFPLALDETRNPLTVHPYGHTQITLGTIAMITYFGADDFGLPNTLSLLDNTASGVYLNNKLLFCTTQGKREYLKRFTDLSIDWKNHISYSGFTEIPSYKGQDKIRVSRNQEYLGVTILPTAFPMGGLQIINVEDSSSRFVELPYVGDLALSDTKAYVGEPSAIRPIDLATAKTLPAIPIGVPNDTRVNVKNMISGYSNQSL